MSFVPNKSQQLNIFDTAIFSKNLNEVLELKQYSYLKTFSEEVFPLIDEEQFAVLYADNPASRPNTPVNVIVGAEILKQLFHITDDAVVLFVRGSEIFQYLLHTSSDPKQQFSDRTLSRFRCRLAQYEHDTGIDLMHACLESVFEKLRKRAGISDRLKRVDSLMVESSMKKLNRYELLYVVFTDLLTCLRKHDLNTLLEGFEGYLDVSNYNEMFYHCSKDERSNRFDKMLDDISTLLCRLDGNEECKSFKEYDLFCTTVAQQTDVNELGARFLRPAKSGMRADIVQSPRDPDATSRKKAGKYHRGYVANLVEAVGKAADGTDCGIIIHYQTEPNIKADVKFMQDELDKLPDAASDSEDNGTIVADGAYHSYENKEEARKKGIELITTDLTGKDTPDANADFKLSEDGQHVESCAAGHAPINEKYDPKTESVKAIYDKETCQNCPYHDQCHPKMKKNVAEKKISKKMVARAKDQRFHNSDEITKYSHVRNGIEASASALRRGYNIDHLPVRGLRNVRYWLGFKIAALNCRKFFDCRTRQDQCALKQGNS
ncbi:MAG: transposase [Clostridia bacterium]|nr:transposase [Clostridia bacterium]